MLRRIHRINGYGSLSLWPIGRADNSAATAGFQYGHPNKLMNSDPN
jgi:hypothetical protein